MHVIGYILDQENQRIKTAERVHRLLLDTSHQRQVAGQPYKAVQLTDDFLAAFAGRFEKVAPLLRDRILAFINTESTFRYADKHLSGLSPLEAEAHRRAMAGYSHPQVEEGARGTAACPGVSRVSTVVR